MIRTILLSLFLLAPLTAAPDPASWPKHKNGKHLVVPQKGWTVYLNPVLLEEQKEKTHTMLKLLDVQLQRVEKTVPEKALKHLQTVPIWINPTYEGTGAKAEYHPGEKWLKDNGRDPILVKCVEITNVQNFTHEDIRMPYLLLHELAHAYHDQVIGFDDKDVINAFRKAAASGGYNSVKRWTGKKYTTDRAYAMANHKEYFAETTEALFGKNDFFPFNREELTKHDPTALKVLMDKWGVKK